MPQIQNVIMAGSGQETRRGWERSDERPESYSEVQYNAKTRTTLNNEHGDRIHRNDHDILDFYLVYKYVSLKIMW